MLDRVASAIEQKDYQTASKLLKQLLKESPENPWVQFYVGRLHEVSGKHQEAAKIYRLLLRDSTHAKILTQARQGLQRLEDFEKAQRQEAIAQATADASSTEPGVLILEPISPELKTQAAQKFARLMQLDSYSARLLLPSRGWRVYRTGAIGQLKYYGEQLRNAEIPCFWVKLTEIKNIKVFQVNYFQASHPKVDVNCRNDENQLGSFTFDWLEVKGRVLGLLPIFEQVVDLGVRRQLNRKTQTQDYFQFYDLHLPGKGCILRLHDNGYEFTHGLEIANRASQNTMRINWNSLLGWVDQKLPKVPVWSDFTPFAETVVDQTDILNQIPSHIHLFRREESNWDAAFHLYSSLVFLKNRAEREI